MSDLQKNNVERFLREQRQTKRDLANFLKIKENSINRTLKNPNISIRKLEKIAEFLGVEVQDIISDRSVADGSQNKFKSTTGKEKENQMTIGNLSEALNRSSKTIEALVKIIAESNIMVNSK